jgi:predicted  nucleic acid-binding Zn-ribbon protein
LCALLYAPSYAIAQEAQPETSPVSDNEGVAQQKIKSLKSIAQSLREVRQSVVQLQQELGSPSARGREVELKDKIGDLSDQADSLRQNFSEIATGVDVSLFGVSKEEIAVDWQKEVETLLGPLLNEIKRLTSGPRELEHYRSQIDSLEDQQKSIAEALRSLDLLSSALEGEKGALGEGLARERKIWDERQRHVDTQLEIYRQKLSSKLSERKSVMESVKSLPALFFKSRGRNLFLAFLATFIFWIVLRKLQGQINLSMQNRGRGKSFRYRLFAVGYLFAAGIGSLLVFLIVLFFFGDWVLLILGVMFLLGLVWSSRQALPKYWNQAALLLNLGPVREGERIQYQGLSWRVKTISFYTMLENPELDGGVVKVPIKDLTDLRSRESGDNERWFATNPGDWLVVNDNFGKIIHQGVDLVRIVEPGGSILNIPTVEFASLHPVVLSSGFRIGVSFGIDYRHQAEVTTTVCELLESDVRKGLIEAGCDERQVSCSVEFQEAASSSLNLYIICDFRGELASKYQKFRRKISALAVDSCNTHGWSIPFDQLTVHLDSSAEKAA